MRLAKQAEGLSSKINKIRYLRSLSQDNRKYIGTIIDIREFSINLYIEKLDMDIFIDVDDYSEKELQINKEYFLYKNKKYRLGDKLKVECIDYLFYLLMDCKLV